MDEDTIRRIGNIATARHLRVHPTADRDEVMSDAFLGIAIALTKVDATRSDAEQIAYILRRAQGEIINSWRQRTPGSRSINGIPPAPVSLDSMAEAGRVPARLCGELEQAEARAIVMVAYRCLTDRERNVLTSTIGYGYSLREIAERLGFTRAYAGVVSAKALRKTARLVA